MTAKQIDEEEGVVEVKGTEVREIGKNEGGKKVKECDRAGRMGKR